MKPQKVYVIALVSTMSGIMILLTCLVILRLFYFNYNTIPQNGMYPGLPAGSRFITRRSPYQNVHDIKRGDVVVFMQTTDLGTYKYVWRVVGLPGDLVEVSNDSVSLNGQALRHEMVRNEGQYLIVREWNGDVSYEVAYEQTLDRSEPPPFASMKVPDDHLFLLGDNRYMAQDSSVLGAVPFASIVERKVFD